MNLLLDMKDKPEELRERANNDESSRKFALLSMDKPLLHMLHEFASKCEFEKLEQGKDLSPGPVTENFKKLIKFRYNVVGGSFRQIFVSNASVLSWVNDAIVLKRDKCKQIHDFRLPRRLLNMQIPGALRPIYKAPNSFLREFEFSLV